VRVGRAPIDEDAIRLLEEHNPDVQFDWTRILKSPGPVHEPGSREDRRERRRDRPRPSPASTPARHRPEEGILDIESEPSVSDPTDHAEATIEAAQAGKSPDATDFEEQATDDGQRITDHDIDPRYARIGAEGLARLRARYAEVMARIAEKPLEETQREELRVKAERLNPDAWVTADEVVAALEQYEAVFEELRAVVGRHQGRRRRRR
jgi:hypothetical protein